jgi:hypothetical protein
MVLAIKWDDRGPKTGDGESQQATEGWLSSLRSRLSPPQPNERHTWTSN